MIAYILLFAVILIIGIMMIILGASRKRWTQKNRAYLIYFGSIISSLSIIMCLCLGFFLV